jgi:hypothetical protein
MLDRKRRGTPAARTTDELVKEFLTTVRQHRLTG